MFARVLIMPLVFSKCLANENALNLVISNQHHYQRSLPSHTSNTMLVGFEPVEDLNSDSFVSIDNQF